MHNCDFLKNSLCNKIYFRFIKINSANMAATKTAERWLPIESNPEVMNSFLRLVFPFLKIPLGSVVAPDLNLRSHRIHFIFVKWKVCFFLDIRTICWQKKQTRILDKNST